MSSLRFAALRFAALRCATLSSATLRYATLRSGLQHLLNKGTILTHHKPSIDKHRTGKEGREVKHREVAGFAFQILHRDLDSVGDFSVLEGEEGGLVAEEVLQDVKEELVRVALEGEELGEALGELVLELVLLRVDPRVEHDGDCCVDVVLADVLAEVHLCVCLGHADDGLDVADGEGDSAGADRLAAELGVE